MYNTIVLQLNNLVSKYFVSIPTHKSTCVGQLSHYPLLVSSSIINNVFCQEVNHCLDDACTVS